MRRRGVHVGHDQRPHGEGHLGSGAVRSGRAEIHRHLGFYYLLEDIRPREAVRQFGHSLAVRERIGDPRLLPSALVALSEAEIAAGRPRRAIDLVRRALTVARQASLLPWRVQDAEETLRKAEAAAQGGR